MFAQIFAFFLAAWNFNVVNNFMATKLFRIKSTPNDQTKGGHNYLNRSRRMNLSSYPYFKEYLCSWFSCLTCCDCRTRKEKAFEIARDRLEKEMSIIEFIKKQRYLSKAIK